MSQDRVLCSSNGLTDYRGHSKLLGDAKLENIPARPGDFPSKEISSELAKRELGWEPKVSFEQGLRRYIEWYRKEEEKRESKWAQFDEILKS